jgi:gamma-butyrobetaine dioxygenase
MHIVDTILDLFKAHGAQAYLGEPVSQQEHALQTAYLANREQAPDTLVAAALLHDIGHLLTLDESAANLGIDHFHEEQASAWLAAHFDGAVTEPIRLHVLAKRYLCAEQNYMRALSPASLRSLELQGGPLKNDDLLRFRETPYHREAVRLRRWDDRAKVPGWAVPDIAHYAALLHRVAKSG